MSEPLERVEVDNISTRRPRRRHGENRERLITAGIREFGTWGYHGASTSRIGAAADVPQPHIYANFSTKLELFVACVERVSHELRHGTAQNTVIETPGRMHLQQFRLLFQALACSHELHEEAPQLRADLLAARDALGDDHFDQAIVIAGQSLLMPSSH